MASNMTINKHMCAGGCLWYRIAKYYVFKAMVILTMTQFNVYKKSLLNYLMKMHMYICACSPSLYGQILS